MLYPMKKVVSYDEWRKAVERIRELKSEADRYRTALAYIVDHKYVAKVKSYADDGSNKWINEFVEVAETALAKDSLHDTP